MISVPVQDSSQVAAARRLGTAYAASVGFEGAECSKIELILTEIATNLLKHAGEGEIMLRDLSEPYGSGVEILSLDKGPGIPDAARAFSNGFSTAGSPGTGLGAIARLSSQCDIWAAPGQGTALLARVLKPSRSTSPGPRSQFRLGVISLPMPGENDCGDAWTTTHRLEGLRVMVADGLGHGTFAQDASRAAVRVTVENGHLAPVDLVHRIHDGLRATRGAAVAVADIQRTDSSIRYVGVGNIAGAVITEDKIRQMVSHNGTAGHQVSKVQEFSYPWRVDSTLVMHSDGLISHWSLSPYPGLLQKDPSLIAGVLYRDFGRGRDDVTVVVVRESGAARPGTG
jgi:anti-sigma regulatory factor (Ser/Thr protein kinase)